MLKGCVDVNSGRLFLPAVLPLSGLLSLTLKLSHSFFHTVKIDGSATDHAMRGLVCVHLPGYCATCMALMYPTVNSYLLLIMQRWIEILSSFHFKKKIQLK